MSERLTDEQLHETAENARGDVARTMAAELIVLRAYELNRDKEVTALRARVAKLETALKELREYAGSVWFDEASATDEEHELMHRSRAALTPPPPPSERSES